MFYLYITLAQVKAIYQKVASILSLVYFVTEISVTATPFTSLNSLNFF